MIDLGILALSAAIALPCGYVGYLYDPNRKEKKELQEKWDKACRNLKLIDKDNNIPFLNTLEKTSYGFSATTILPFGISLEKFQSVKNTIEDNISAILEIKKSKYNENVGINIINSKPSFKFKPIKASANELWIGHKANGQAFKIKLNLDPHLLIGGTTGTGKTFLLSTILTNLIYNNSNKIELYLSQIMKSEIGVFKNCKCVMEVSYDLATTRTILKKLAAEVDKRSKKFTDEGIRNLNQWNEIKDKKDFLKRLFIVIEEVSFFIAAESDEKTEKELKKECWDYISTIVKAGRSSGVHLMSCTQRSTCANIPAEIKAQMSRISFRQRQANDSENIISTKEATRLEAQEFIFNGSSYEYLIASKIDEEFKDLQSYVKEIIIPGKKEVKKVIKDYRAQEKHERLTLNKEEFEKMLATARAEKNISKENKVIQLSSKKEEYQALSLSAKEKEIYKFIESYGAITIKQATRLFFRDNSNYKSAYSSCSRTLIKMQKNNALKSEVNKQSGEKMYFITRAKTVHDLNIINAYIELLEKNIEITNFKLEQRLLNGKIRPDGLLEFKLKGQAYKAYLECDMTHFTNQKKISSYEMLKENIILIIGRNKKLDVKSDKIKIYHTLEDFSDIYSIDLFSDNYNSHSI